MKITVFAPKKEFTEKQQNRLSKLGTVVYTKNRQEYPLEMLIKLAKGSDIIALDPDNFGGFDTSKNKVTKLIATLPNLKGVAISSSYAPWIDLDYCKKRNLMVTNVPFFCTESIAEDTLALLIALAKKIIISDRRTQKGQFKLEMGFELKGKTLGILGLGHIGQRVAELANAIGMNVIFWNHKPKKTSFMQKSLDYVLTHSDAISINLDYNKDTTGLLSKERINKIKPGAIVVDTTGVGREIVDEKAMAKALKSGKISAFAYEGENITSGPLAKIENAIGLYIFGWYTKDAVEREMKLWTENILSITKGKPLNPVSQISLKV